MVDAAPGHVGDVQQAVDAAEVHEGAVLGDVLDDAVEDLALFERLEGLVLLLGVLLFEHGLAGEHDVAALLVDLDHAHPELLAPERVEVAHRPHVDLAARQEGADADVDGEAALDPLDDPARDDAALLVGALDLVPDLHLLGLLLGEDDVAVAVLGLLDEDVDGVAGLDRDLAVLVAELLERDHALGLVADVDDDLALGDAQHDAPHHLALGEVAEADVVHVEEPLVLLGVVEGGLVGLRRAAWLRWGSGGAASGSAASGAIGVTTFSVFSVSGMSGTRPPGFGIWLGSGRHAA